MKKHPGFVYLIFLLAIVSCQKNEHQKETVKIGNWRALLPIQGQELPFTLVIDRGEDSVLFAAVKNSTELLRFDKTVVKEDSVIFKSELFDAAVIAVVDGNEMKGKWVRNGLNEPYEVPFSAQYGVDYRFSDKQTPPSEDLSGTWDVTFNGKEADRKAVGMFQQTGNLLTGTFRTSTGDYRFLEGEVQDAKFSLSAFDGTHAYLFKGQIINKDSISGEYWSGKTRHETWSAQRDATVAPAEVRTTMKKEDDHVSFSFPDIKGGTVSMEDGRFQNKVVIVQLLGSWCPNCMDETQFLSEWYSANKHRDVEIIGLAFERSEEFEKAKVRVEKLRDRFNVKYPLLIAGTPNDESVEAALPFLDNFKAYPTTIYIDKKGRVRKIHAGFDGPATGSIFKDWKNEFDEYMNELITE